MNRSEDLYDKINFMSFVRAAERAADGHEDKNETLWFMVNLYQNCEWLYHEFVNNTYHKLLTYTKSKKVNPNGKRRDIDSPSFITRVYQYVFLMVIEPLYYKVDPMLGINCKPSCGITSDYKSGSVVKRLKHIYYDCRQISAAVVIDQRKCYKHVTIPVFRRMLRRLVKDQKFVDFAVNVCFVDGRLPVGTPTSPMAHHILMLPFDLWIKSEFPLAVRYADDNYIPCESKREAQQIKWRIKNYWWYVLKIRSKRHTTKVIPLNEHLDFCGYVLHRNHGKTVNSRNKGYVSVRGITFDKACRSTNKNWGSYFGILRHADVFSEMERIEEDMDLRKLTRKIRIERDMDAPSITPEALAAAQTVFTVYKYKFMRDSKDRVNWIKCLIGYPELDENGEETGRILAAEFHGNYKFIIEFHLKLEKRFHPEDILPMTNCKIVNSCGYIYEGSTNQIQFIEE